MHGECTQNSNFLNYLYCEVTPWNGTPDDLPLKQLMRIVGSPFIFYPSFFQLHRERWWWWEMLHLGLEDHKNVAFSFTIISQKVTQNSQK